MATQFAPESRAVPARHPDRFSPDEVKELSRVLNALLADDFGLYIKTKNFYWLTSGVHFRDYHLLLNGQADQILKTIDEIADRVRRIGGITPHSIGQIERLKRIADNDQDFVPVCDMVAELHSDNLALVDNLCAAHELTSRFNDYATTSLIEVWIDEAERRSWLLFEATR